IFGIVEENTGNREDAAAAPKQAGIVVAILMGNSEPPGAASRDGQRPIAEERIVVFGCEGGCAERQGAERDERRAKRSGKQFTNFHVVLLIFQRRVSRRISCHAAPTELGNVFKRLVSIDMSLLSELCRGLLLGQAVQG